MSDYGKYHSPLLFHFILCRLKPLDIEFMKQLDHLVNIIPVIAKADTLTASELKTFKTKVCYMYNWYLSNFECIYELLIFQVMSEIMENGIHIYTGEIDEEDDSSEIRDLKV